MGPTSKLCGGWSQALELSERLIGEGNLAHARHNLVNVKSLVQVFATPQALGLLTPAQRDEIRALQRRLAAAWRALADAAKRAADADARRLAG